MIGGYETFDRKLQKHTRISNFSHLSNKENIWIGDHAFIGHFNYIDGYQKVHIGDGTQITNHISILTHSSHNAIRLYGDQYATSTELTEGIVSGEVYIGDYTFIGPNSTIMPGTSIGKGSIVSAHSYVEGQFPENSILRGQPAKVVGSTIDIDKSLLEEYPELKNSYYNRNS